jgi:hypothetical protein
MLMVGGDHLIAGLPVETVADDVHPLAGIIGQGNFVAVGREQMRDSAASFCIDLEHRLEGLRPQTAIPPVPLYVPVHRLNGAAGQGTEGAGIQIAVRGGGGQLGADLLQADGGVLHGLLLCWDWLCCR